MIDWPHITELRNELGAEDFEEVLSIFYEEAEETFTLLAAGPNKNPAEPLHFLKGSARTIGFAQLATLCEAAEKAGQTDIDALRHCLALSRAMLANLPVR